MSCKKTWFNLPKSIDPTLNWFNLPKQLDSILEQLKVEKPNCYESIYPNGHKKFVWFNLPKQAETLCQLQNCNEIT